MFLLFKLNYYTADKFVSVYGGDWGFDGRDMVITLKTAKAVKEVKKIIPKGVIEKERSDGKNVTVCRF